MHWQFLFPIQILCVALSPFKFCFSHKAFTLTIVFLLWLILVTARVTYYLGTVENKQYIMLRNQQVNRLLYLLNRSLNNLIFLT